MKILSISYKNKEISRSRITHPLVLVGRSPLCDILLRAPGVGAVQFIMEWIGEGEFRAETSSRDEWVLTEAAKFNSENERQLKKTAKGQGVVFYNEPLKLGDFTFSWIEDRLIEADLSKKIISQQLNEMDEKNDYPQGNIPCVLEVVSINGELDSVVDVQHYSFLRPREWKTSVLSQFSAFPQIEGGVRSAHISIPKKAKSQLIQQGNRNVGAESGDVSLFLHDVLHVETEQSEFYFRVVPKVMGPASRRSIWSDPFYIISVFCVLIGAFGFFLIFRNVKTEEKIEVVPPRIAKIEVVEVKPPPPPPEVKKETAPPPEEKLLLEKEKIPEPVKKEIAKEIEPNGMIKTGAHEKIQKPAPVVSPEISDNNSKQMKTSLKVVDRNKGGLNLPTEKSAVNRTGLLAVLKKNKNVGMIKADQVVENGLVNDTVKGDKANFVLQQSPSGVVNSKYQKTGDALAAASTRVNMNDTVGSGSINANRGNVLHEGFKANYGVSGEGGASGAGEFASAMDAQVEGGLDRASVQSAIRAFKSEIRTCYERALQIKSGAGGRVSYKFQIKAAGNVEWINIFKNDIESNSLVSCVEGIIKRINFPKAKNGQNTIVIYPFQFERKGTGQKK